MRPEGIKKLAIVVCVFGVLLFTTGAFGRGKDRAGQSGATTGQVAILSKTFHRRGKCTKASVALGSRADVIKFRVWCRGGMPERRVGFVITRLIIPNHGIHSGITNVEHAPALVGPRDTHRFGGCELVRGRVMCDALSGGRTQFQGSFRVRAKPCRWKFVITTHPPSGHEGEGLFGAEQIRVLSNSRPEGCKRR